jgi:hypothetical protein
MSRLKHSAQIVITLRGQTPDESAGEVRLEISKARAEDVLEWLEVPLGMLRKQAEHDKAVHNA